MLVGTAWQDITPSEPIDLMGQLHIRKGTRTRDPLTVNAVTEDRGDGPCLTATWSWAAELLTEQDVEELARGWFAALEALTATLAEPGATGLTPSDLPLVTITGDELEKLEERWSPTGLADVLPLSPLQEGLLFHALYDDSETDGYVTQLVFGLDGPLDTTALRASVGALLERHQNLRAGFLQLASGTSVQVIPAGS